MKRATREWLKKAEHDYLAAVALSRLRKVPLRDQVCFHYQQSAEKYLKARLKEADVHIPKTHDLEKLLALLVPFEPLWSTLTLAAQRLSHYAVTIRCPGDEATAVHVKRAKQDAQLIREEVRQALGI